MEKVACGQLMQKSGSNFDTIEIEVVATVAEGIQISVEEGINVPGVGDSMQIKIIGVSQTVQIEIVSVDGEIIDTLEFVASSGGRN